MRKPLIENKYSIKPKDIQKAIIVDHARITHHPFWRNDVIGAWCLSGGAGSCIDDTWSNSYWIGFYDDDAKAYAGKIRLDCSSDFEMCSYKFKEFFDYSEIANEADLELQEKLLVRLNWLIEEGIIKLNN